MPHDDDGANDDHPVDGIGPRHQRRMQDGRHIGNYFDTKENRQDHDVDHALVFQKKICKFHVVNGERRMVNGEWCNIHHSPFTILHYFNLSELICP